MVSPVKETTTPKITKITIDPNIINNGIVINRLLFFLQPTTNPAIAGTIGRQQLKAVTPAKNPSNNTIGYVRKVTFSRYEANLVIISNIHSLLALNDLTQI